MKSCKVCGKILVKKNWPHWRKRVRHRLCYKCGLARYRKWYKKSSKTICERQRQYRRKCKEELVAAYGGKCFCCGEKAIEFLTIEHTQKDGAKHRREIGGTNRMHSWLKKNGYPKDGYSILCFNCNAADFYYGKCPHKSFRLSSGLGKE